MRSEHGTTGFDQISSHQVADCATLAGDTDSRASGSIGLQRMPSAVRLLRLRFGCSDLCSAPMGAGLFVLLDAVESLFKLGDQRSLTRSEAVAAHDAPKITSARPLVPVVHGHDIFGRSACHKDNDVGVGGLVDQCQFAPSLNGVLHGADRVPIFGDEVRIELISIVGSNVDITCIGQSARKRRYGCATGFRRCKGGKT